MKDSGGLNDGGKMKTGFLNRLSFSGSLFNLGFRIFFLSASVYAVLVMGLWIWAYPQGASIQGQLSPGYWHGHEMIFGYAMSVVAGFLLTAVGNWTGQAMPHGAALARIWLVWLAARCVFVLLPQWQSVGVGLDMLFNLLLLIAILKPILAVKQWRQIGIVSKVALMLVANACFLLGLLGWSKGLWVSLYVGVFVIVGLVLTIGRRVIPFFVSKALPEAGEMKNSVCLDRLSLGGFLLVMLGELGSMFSTAWAWQLLTSVSGAIAAVAQIWRLCGWYHRGIWRKPLLWSMFLSMFFVAVGMLMYALGGVMGHSLPLHALAVGGMGMLSLSMMARVSLGHTGRNVQQPPKLVFYALILLSAAMLARVGLPIVWPAQYLYWISIAQWCWLLAFLLLALGFARIWVSPRIDGKKG